MFLITTIDISSVYLHEALLVAKVFLLTFIVDRSNYQFPGFQIERPKSRRAQIFSRKLFRFLLCKFHHRLVLRFNYLHGRKKNIPNIYFYVFQVGEGDLNFSSFEPVFLRSDLLEMCWTTEHENLCRIFSKASKRNGESLVLCTQQSHSLFHVWMKHMECFRWSLKGSIKVSLKCCQIETFIRFIYFHSWFAVLHHKSPCSVFLTPG